MRMKKKDVTIIGAGMGGLFSGALWASDGYNVSIYESHYASGGCAGYFKRKEGYYDVGATTISGMKKGRPLEKLFKKVGINIPMTKLDKAIEIIHPNFQFSYYTDIETFHREFHKTFGIDARDYVNDLMLIEERLWESLNIFSSFPRIKITHLCKFIFSKNISLLKSYQIFTKTFYDFLPKEWRRNEKLISMIDQLLLISTQQKSRTCPAFIGILGFLYPFDTYHVDGGMRILCKGLEELITQRSGKLHFKEKINRVNKAKNSYIVNTSKEEFETEVLISAARPGIINPNLQKAQKWTAITSYLYLDNFDLKECHYQVHLNKSQRDLLNSDSIFISSSLKEDRNRSTTHKQIITISTHAKKGCSDISIKEKFKDVIIDVFKEHFGLEDSKLNFDSVATAKTFTYFTQRVDGEVGGIIVENLKDLFKLAPNKYNQNTYFVGDYSFPGQGLVAIARGALNTRSI